MHISSSSSTSLSSLIPSFSLSFLSSGAAPESMQGKLGRKDGEGGGGKEEEGSFNTKMCGLGEML